MFRRVVLVLVTAYFATSASGQTLRFVETAGKPVTVRVVTLDPDGRTIGSGRLVTMLPSESRELRMRDHFASEALVTGRVQVEILGGEGEVDVTSEGLIVERTSSTPKRRAVAPHASPTTDALIDKAEAAGAISAETALLYRVYFLFGDARLPQAFRGVDTPVTDSGYMSEVRRLFPTLSPATQAIVQPFLVPPAYKDSWVNTKSGETHTSDILPPPCQLFSDNWAYIDAQASPVRVWYRADSSLDKDTAAKLSVHADKIWPVETGLMHKTGTPVGVPLSDATEGCGAGDSRLDVYLTDMGQDVGGETIPFDLGCAPTPTFIEVSREGRVGTLIHEMFHAIQASYLGCLAKDDYRWWTEGSAKWSEDFVESAVYPGLQSEHDSAMWYMLDPKLPLDHHEGAMPYHGYGTYLLPFYVARSSGSADFVRVAWENCATQPAIESFNAAISSLGGLDKVWPQFAAHNYNQPPVDDYQKWDQLTDRVKPEKFSDQTFQDEIEIDEMNYSLPHTSSVIYEINKKNLYGPSVVFWNGATSFLAERQLTPAIGQQYMTDPVSSDVTKGTHVTAMFRVGDNWRQEDWTSKPSVVLCRDDKADNWDEMVIVISNADMDRNRKIQPPGRPPMLYIASVGCSAWKGTVSYSGGPIGSNADVTFRRVDSTIHPPAINYKATGALSWSISTPNCSTSQTTTVGATNSITTYNFLPPDNPAHGTYVAAGSNIVTACGQPLPIDWWITPPPPLVPGIPFARWLHTDSGEMFDTNAMTPPAVWQWQLQSQSNQ